MKIALTLVVSVVLQLTFFTSLLVTVELTKYLRDIVAIPFVGVTNRPLTKTTI
jgi:hypothetical protein